MLIVERAWQGDRDLTVDVINVSGSADLGCEGAKGDTVDRDAKFGGNRDAKELNWVGGGEDKSEGEDNSEGESNSDGEDNSNGEDNSDGEDNKVGEDTVVRDEAVVGEDTVVGEDSVDWLDNLGVPLIALLTFENTFISPVSLFFISM